MTYEDALRLLEERGEARIELGLERMREHLRSLGSPHERLRVIHVAGTNGKGSVCAMLDAGLRAAGYKTGLYTSPHLHGPVERMRIDGVPIPEADFARLLEIATSGPLGGALTYFELLTSVAFQWFVEQKVDVAVLETGLGGRLDATNVVPAPLACVITSISLDHVKMLGDTTSQIAGEKAAIAKAGRPLLCAPLDAEPLARVLEQARLVGAQARVVAPEYKTVSVDWERGRQTLSGPRGEIEISLLGSAQAGNAALARAALDAVEPELRVDQAAWRAGLARLSWSGRFEVLRVGTRRVILDGAHNPEASRCLAQTWAASPWSRSPSRWIFALMRDKDAAGVLAPLRPHARDVVAVRAPSPRSLGADELARSLRESLPEARVGRAPDVEAALKDWLESEGPDTAVVCGSFYLVADAARALSRRNHAFSL